MPAAKNPTRKLFDLAGEFVTSQQGNWNHNDWESLLEKVGKAGFSVDDDTKRNLGNLLEAGKFFYSAMPQNPPKRRPAPRKKATPS
jgi:hypothetical protein